MNNINIEAFIKAYKSNIAHVTDADKIRAIIFDYESNGKYPDDTDEMAMIDTYFMLNSYLQNID